MQFIEYNWPQVVHMLTHALYMLILNPILYIATMFIVWDLLRNVKAERRFFGVRVTRIWKPLFVRYVIALIVGFLVTLVCLSIGIEVRQSEIFVVSGLAIVLGGLRLRWASTSVAISVFIAVTWFIRQWARPSWPWFHGTWVFFNHVHMIDWTGLLGVCMIIQFIMMALSRHVIATPTLVASRRGRKIGAFLMQLVFVVPVGVLIPGVNSAPHVPVHWPWLAVHGGITFSALPMLVGWSAATSTNEPRHIVRRAMVDAFISLVVLGGLVYIALQWSLDLSLLGAGLVLVVQELFVAQLRWREGHLDPICTPHNDGVVVLCTIKGSLAEQMGLKPGEVITHVNQVPVHSEYDLHFAFDQNPAYAKLQVMDRHGELRIVGKPVYAGERHQLGLILAPQEAEGLCYRNRPIGLLETLYLRMSVPASGYTHLLEKTESMTSSS